MKCPLLVTSIETQAQLYLHSFKIVYFDRMIEILHV